MVGNLEHLDFRGWFYGLLSAIIGGGASSVTAAVAASYIKPGDFAFAGADSLKLMFSVFGINALISMFLYLKQSPLPAIVEDNANRITAIETRNAAKDVIEDRSANKEAVKSAIKEAIEEVKP